MINKFTMIYFSKVSEGTMFDHHQMVRIAKEDPETQSSNKGGQTIFKLGLDHTMASNAGTLFN